MPARKGPAANIDLEWETNPQNVSLTVGESPVYVYFEQE